MSKNNTPAHERKCATHWCPRLVGKSGAKGYCPRHYHRLRKYGDPLAILPEDYYGAWAKCAINECRRPARNKTSELCKMHYHRAYRNGEAGEATERIRQARAGKCTVEGCSKPDLEGIYCKTHGARVRRHGDPHKVIAAKDREMPTGGDHPHWKGDQPGYGAAHERVTREKGRASEHDCVDCGDAAYHWSYTHQCKDEVVRDVRGYIIAYSPHPDQYVPRCVPCHKRFDLGRNDSFPVDQYYPLDGAI